MAYGLRLYDSYGNNVMDIGDRVTRLIGFYGGYIPQWQQSPVDIVVPGLALDGTWFVLTDVKWVILQMNNGYVRAYGNLGLWVTTGGAFNFYVMRC